MLLGVVVHLSIDGLFHDTCAVETSNGQGNSTGLSPHQCTKNFGPNEGLDRSLGMHNLEIPWGQARYRGIPDETGSNATFQVIDLFNSSPEIFLLLRMFVRLDPAQSRL